MLIIPCLQGCCRFSALEGLELLYSKYKKYILLALLLSSVVSCSPRFWDSATGVSPRRDFDKATLSSSPSTVPLELANGLRDADSAKDGKDSGNFALPTNSPDDLPRNISLGLLVTLSGQYSNYGSELRDGLNLAISECNRCNITLVTVDDAGDASKASRDFDLMANNDDIVIVLGPFLASSVESVLHVAERRNLPFVHFSKRGSTNVMSSNSFSLGITAYDQVASIVDAISKDVNLRDMILLYPSTNFGNEFRIAFERLKSKIGDYIKVQQINYNKADRVSIENVINVIEGGVSHPQVIFVADGLETSGLIVKELRSLAERDDSEILVMGPAAWSDMGFLSARLKLFDGVIFVSAFNPYSNSNEVTEFLQKYRVAYGREPGLHAAQGYDAGRMALKCARSPSLTRIDNTQDRRSMVTTCFKNFGRFGGVTGALSVNSSGVIHRKMPVLQMKDGAIISWH